MDRPDVHAIAIGGSAGALDVLLAVLPALPVGLDAAVIVVVHTAANGSSLMARILSDACALPVREAEDKLRIERGTIYVAPAGYHLLVERGGGFALSVDEPVHFSRPSIDVLFETASDAFGPGLVGLLLSGANADGAAGLLRIHRAGGVALVQSPASAATETMPQAAIARLGDAARVVEVSAMASLVVDLAGVTVRSPT